MIRSISSAKMLRRPALLGTAVVALALLGGCDNIPENLVPPPRPMPTSQPVRADWVEAQHTVPFGQHQTRLSPAGVADIDAFLRRVDFGAGDRVAVTADTLGAATAMRTLAERRRAAVIKYLKGRGITAAPADMVSTGANANVTIRIGRYVAKVPDCPEWNQLGPGYVDTQFKDFGCLTYTALGNMVVDPGDLAHGEPLAPGDATKMSKGVQNYREGKTPALLSAPLSSSFKAK